MMSPGFFKGGEYMNDQNQGQSQGQDEGQQKKQQPGQQDYEDQEQSGQG